MQINIQVGLRIKHLRRKMGLSQERLALKAEIDRTYLAGVESGKRNVTISSLEKIVTALNLSMSDFFNFEKDVDYE